MHFKDRKQLNQHKVDAKHINFKQKKADGDEEKADGDEERENNEGQSADEVEAVAEQEIVQDTYFTFQLYLSI